MGRIQCTIDPRIFPIAEILPIKKVQVIEPVIE